MSTKYRITDHQVPHFFTLTVAEWVDVFSRQVYKDILIQSLQFCIKNKGLLINAYVIMTNHLHLIAKVREAYNLTNTIRDFKRYTADYIYRCIKEEPAESRRNWMLWLFESQGERSSSNVNFKFWQHENHPILLNSNEMTDARLEYIHQNPVKAGICFRSEDYVYSSASDYAGDKGVLEVELIC